MLFLILHRFSSFGFMVVTVLLSNVNTDLNVLSLTQLLVVPLLDLDLLRQCRRLLLPKETIIAGVFITCVLRLLEKEPSLLD